MSLKGNHRSKSLVIIGDSMVGKSAYAESEGNPIVINSGWCMKSIFPGATHLVNDVRPAAFGYAGKFLGNQNALIVGIFSSKPGRLNGVTVHMDMQI